MTHYIIGAGGGGSWLCPALRKSHPHDRIVVVDGDTYEDKNLDRQLFDADLVGKNKAEALASMHKCEFIPRYFNMGDPEIPPFSTLWVCVDNHPSRRDALGAADFYGCMAVLGGNERTTAQAMVFMPEWRGTHRDPRIRHPEISTETRFDPRRREIGCIEAVAAGDTQWLSGNVLSVGLMLHLYNVWHIEGQKLNRDERLLYLPFEFTVNMSSAEVRRGEDVALAQQSK